MMYLPVKRIRNERPILSMVRFNFFFFFYYFDSSLFFGGFECVVLLHMRRDGFPLMIYSRFLCLIQRIENENENENVFVCRNADGEAMPALYTVHLFHQFTMYIFETQAMHVGRTSVRVCNGIMFVFLFVLF